MNPRTELGLAVAALIAVCLFVAFYKPHTANAPVSTGQLIPIPSKDISLIPTTPPAFIAPTSTFENILPHIQTSTTTVKKRTFTQIVITPPKVVQEAVLPSKTASTAVVSSTPEEAPAPQSSTLKNTLVNILCISHKAPLRGTSGSGVFISSNGMILTVAHVAEAVLLSQELGEGVISCTIRTGSPAVSAYKAKVAYISEPWLRKNPTTLISSQPMGTGENDIALLAVTSGVNGHAVPQAFPHLSLSSGTLSVGDEVALGGYGAQYLSTTDVRTNLHAIFKTGQVTSVYTFGGNTEDVVAILGGNVAQEGSSGGSGTDDTGGLAGLITTSEITGDFSARHVRLITPLHIRASFESDMHQSLSSYIADTSVSSVLSNYQPKINELGSFLAHSIGME